MACPTYSEISMDVWAKDLLAPVSGKRYPLGGTIELTDRCNLSCLHCYINQPVGAQTIRQNELSTDEVKGIIDQITDAGCLYLLFTGGEPLLRPDFTEIYKYAKRHGLLISLFTNATLINDEIADLLADMSIYTIEVSLYGATRATYEAVTQRPGSFERCINGIKRLKSRGIPVGLKSVLLRTNVHELDAMKELADELGMPFRYDGTIWPRINGDEGPYDQRLTASEMITLDTQDIERNQQWREAYDKFSGRLARNEHVFSCGAGYHTFHIDSMGRMSICIMVREPSYDLLQIPFKEAWEALGKLRDLKHTKTTECQTCLAGPLCSQCPGWSQIVHGDLETPVEAVCELGKLRLGVFGY